FPRFHWPYQSVLVRLHPPNLLVKVLALFSPYEQCLLNALGRRGYTKEEVCVHGFRSTASPFLNAVSATLALKTGA
ncbi:MAG: hypothetical protein K6F46_05090, partial [Desulfovibrio sp.]|nr:hypothetical protein [Desulfovibrio sp.]